MRFFLIFINFPEGNLAFVCKFASTTKSKYNKVGFYMKESIYLYLNTRDELVRLNCSKIVYMQGDGNYTHIVLVNKQKVSFCLNLRKMQQHLEEKLGSNASIFIRVGKRFIINHSFIYRIQPALKSLILTDGVNFCFQLCISKEALQEVKSLLVKQYG